MLQEIDYVADNDGNKIRRDEILATKYPGLFQYKFQKYYDSIAAVKQQIFSDKYKIHLFNMNYGLEYKDQLIKYTLGTLGGSEPVQVPDFQIYRELKTQSTKKGQWDYKLVAESGKGQKEEKLEKSDGPEIVPDAVVMGGQDGEEGVGEDVGVERSEPSSTEGDNGLYADGLLPVFVDRQSGTTGGWDKKSKGSFKKSFKKPFDKKFQKKFVPKFVGTNYLVIYYDDKTYLMGREPVDDTQMKQILDGEVDVLVDADLDVLREYKPLREEKYDATVVAGKIKFDNLASQFKNAPNKMVDVLRQYYKDDIEHKDERRMNDYVHVLRFLDEYATTNKGHVKCVKDIKW